MIKNTTLLLLRTRLLQLTLLLICLTLSGCLGRWFCEGYRTEQTTKEDAQHPAVVLLTRYADNIKDLPHKPVHRIVKDANGKESVVVDFNWQKISIAGVPLSAFPKKCDAVEFTLNVFEYDSGKHFPTASITEFEPVDANDRTLVDIPLDTLLRVSVLFKKDKGEDAAPADFVLMFKKGKDLQEAPPQEAPPQEAPAQKTSALQPIGQR